MAKKPPTIDDGRSMEITRQALADREHEAAADSGIDVDLAQTLVGEQDGDPPNGSAPRNASIAASGSPVAPSPAIITLEASVPAFIDSRRNNVSPRTAMTYRSALRRFLRYIDDQERINPESSISRLSDRLDLLLDYADDLAQSGLSESTYTLYLKALNQWLDYLFESNILGDDITATTYQRLRDKLSAKTHISLKSTNLKPEKERRAPGDEVIARFLRAAREDDTVDPDASLDDQRRGELRRLRNIAILETLVSTGARISEVMGLDVGDLLDDEAAVIRRGVGKGDKSRAVFFDEVAWFAVQAYMGETGVRRASHPIFLRHDRGAGDKIMRLSDTGAQREIRRLRSKVVLSLCEDLVRLLLADHAPTEDHVAHLAARIAEDDAWPEQLTNAQNARPELADDVYRLRIQIRQARETTAHSFRHAFATKVLSNTGDLAGTQDLMGHANPNTTRRYAKLSRERLRQLHREGVSRSKSG